jgi:putative membrane protein
MIRFFRRPERFWREIDQIEGSATPYVLKRTLVFGVIALLVTILEVITVRPISIPVTPYEVLGVAMGALLVLRTNAGYERWWEARKLWGGIVNQSRNLVVGALAYGPNDLEWRRQIVAWTAAFDHVCRRSLRGQRRLPELVPLVGSVKAERIASVEHMPSSVAMIIGNLLREATDQLGMDRFAFLRLEEERSRLIDHIGACERILRTPLPIAYSIQIRQFIFVFLVTLPFGLVSKTEWLTPLVTMLVAYPILALDEIGVELQNPFSPRRLNHLPLDDICTNLERNLFALLGQAEGPLAFDRDQEQEGVSTDGKYWPDEAQDVAEKEAREDTESSI